MDICGTFQGRREDALLTAEKYEEIKKRFFIGVSRAAGLPLFLICAINEEEQISVLGHGREHAGKRTEKETERMSLRAILFDMDGTLVPMDQEQFTKGYFMELTAALSPFHVAPEELVAAVWNGTRAMVKNDGRKRNKEVFWEQFAAVAGEALPQFREATDRFYLNEFQRTRKFTAENPLAAEAVRLARKNGRKTVLATNPIFPFAAQKARMGWVGLRPEDFELVTAYETDSFCKPNPRYYLSICERIGVEPQDCLMIGNDENEDMHAAAEAGMRGYLVTDCRIADKAHPWMGEAAAFPR